MRVDIELEVDLLDVDDRWKTLILAALSHLALADFYTAVQ